MRLTTWLAEFRSLEREASFIASEAQASLVGLRLGLSVVAVVTLGALWSDYQLLGAHPEAIQKAFVARGLQLLGLAVAGTTPFRRWLRYPTGVFFNAGALLVATGHALATQAIYLGSGGRPNALWDALFIILVFTAFILPLRYALPAALWFVLSALWQHLAFVEPTTRELALSLISLTLAFGLGTLLCYRLNRGRRHEFATLEIERRSNTQLSEEVEERSRFQDTLLAHNTVLEEKLLAAQRLEAIGQLAGGVAHDLNNLLTPVIGFTELATLEAEPLPEVQRMLDEVSRAANLAKTLVKQLLAFGSRQHLCPVRLNLVELIQEQRTVLRSLVGKGIDLVIVHETSEICPFVDQAQFVQVLVNLVVNARDALPKGGKIQVSVGVEAPQRAEAIELGLDPRKRYATLSVSDNGIGMSASTQQRIFEPFYSTKGPSKGTGLGLSTVHGIVKQHHGAVQVRSQAGQGTTFTCWLPLAKPGECERVSLSRIPLSWRGGTETLLVVDEDSVVRELLTRMLSRSGYQVLAAPNETEALALARTHAGPIHLLICDLTESRPRSVELGAQLRKGRRELRVLYVSGIANESLPDADFLVLPKPFTRAELIGRVRQVLDLPAEQ